jgi:hypothetical protein
MKVWKLLPLLPALIAFSAVPNTSGSSATNPVRDFSYESKFYKIQLTDSLPFIKYFSVDALGEGKIGYNPIQWRVEKVQGEYELFKTADNEVQICPKGERDNPRWGLQCEQKKFVLTSFPSGSDDRAAVTFRFDKHKNHATLLGLMPGKRKTALPAVLHMPDMGSLRVSAGVGVLVDYNARRNQAEEFISVSLPPANKEQGVLKYSFDVTSIYPHFKGVEQPKFAGLRRNYLSLFQVNPTFRALANNSTSDVVAFNLFFSSMLALATPPLADSLRVLDILKMTVERYLDGMKGYGIVGYVDGYEGADVAGWTTPYDALDTYPSLVISACNYIKGSGDNAWAQKYYARIKEWMDRQMSKDRDGNGLVEYELSGNSGSWDGTYRPANWWDTIGFGHEDAYSNAITYEALNLMSLVAKTIGKSEDAQLYRAQAERMKKSYFKTFYNPATGVLAGWKSKDGKLHDYYFLMVNSMAVHYGLVPADQARKIMLTFWNKMREVGFTNFTLGVPGNLVSVRHEDYMHHDPRWGGGLLEDGSDAFQRYENGGASLNYSYFVLEAFKKTGLAVQYQRIADGLLEAINAGAFQGSCMEGGMTKDWKTWSGDCWGYEGFLSDGYLVMLAFVPTRTQ